MKDIVWVERYRPRSVDETILPESMKNMFRQFVKKKHLPNLLLVGNPGVGKTSVARAVLEEIGCDYIVINGSLEGRQIDTLRNEIMNYASSMSLTAEGRKYIILDEADHLNPQTVQPALRNFMEEFSSNCGFILTCNYKSKIIEPLQSRCAVIDFNIKKKDKADLGAQFFKRTIDILKKEKVKFDNKAVATLITKYFPDMRRVLNELQAYSATGSVDSGILDNLIESNIKELIEFMKAKNFTAIRKWVADNADLDSSELFSTLYNLASTMVTPKTIPILVVILGKYQYQDSFVVNKQINTAACLVEIMTSCQFS